MGQKKKKLRVEFRKNRHKDPSRPDFTRQFHQETEGLDDLHSEERISGKGNLSRFRTILTDQADETLRAADLQACLEGRVLRAAGLQCQVRSSDGRVWECTVRQVLRRVAREARTAVVAGDRVLVRPVNDTEGVIERVEPRGGTLSRLHQRREHLLAANVDQVLIVVSAEDPAFKPGLVDRYLISAALGGIQPAICINKVDLVGPERMQPWAGLYARLGYQIVLTSVHDQYGLDHLRHLLSHKTTVLSGQSGVGKSSLLNSIQPGLNLRTGDISSEYRKGRHTTTLAQLWDLGDLHGAVIDTPGIRQMELWQVTKDDLAHHFLEFRPWIPQCRFPGCTHSHEETCAVKFAVDQEFISLSRYQSYLKLLSDLHDESSAWRRPNSTK